MALKSKQSEYWGTLLTRLKQFIRSIWLFPVILTILLILLTVCKINGSSIGSYYALFYGKKNDPELVVNEPQSIRSDEWLINTPMTIAQKNNGFREINQNVGNGQNMSILIDVPYKGWSELFKPHNLVFFVLPLDYAFAFRWWFTAYLLILSCYFFVLALIPRKRFLAIGISLFVFFSPFVQWWYLYGTVGPIYYSLFAGVVFIKILSEKRKWISVLWGLLLAYLLSCFALVFYPPFQIACLLAMAGFAIGYLLEKRQVLPTKILWQKLAILSAAALITGMITFLFVHSRMDVIRSIQNTTYPGNRIQKSGGFDLTHLFANNLGGQLQLPTKAVNYRINHEVTNPSEASNFILLLPFLLLPSFYLLLKQYRKTRQLSYSLLFVNIAFLIGLIWLLLPHIDFIGKLTFLSRVPHSRLLIGLGLLNILQIVLFIRLYSHFKKEIINKRLVLGYVVAVFLIESALSLYVRHLSPGFIRISQAIILSAPIPISLYLLLRKRFEWAILVLMIFSFYMTYKVNPLYKGVHVLTETPVSKAIQNIAKKDSASTWAVEYSTLENFVFMNGGHSLSAVYTYPQLPLWRDADNGSQQAIYNRYAHTSFSFDRNPNANTPTQLELLGQDIFRVRTEPCSSYLKNHQVRYLLAAAELKDNCVSLVKQIDYPLQSFYIYSLN